MKDPYILIHRDGSIIEIESDIPGLIVDIQDRDDETPSELFRNKRNEL